MNKLTIQECLTMTDKELFDHCAIGATTLVENFYCYHDRNAPICLVAHIDTVRRTKDKLELIQENNIIRNKYGILGADDRAGVFGLLELSHLNCNLLFTLGEETGGTGAKLASEELDFKGVKLFIELDRKGCNEYVFYSHTLPKEIQKYVESYGYIENYGTYSDIAEFEEIPGINLSIGYYNQHTNKESLHLDEMFLTIKRVSEMINNPPKKRYKLHRSYRQKYNTNYPFLLDNYPSYEKTVHCHYCYEHFPDYELIEMYGHKYCMLCAEELGFLS